MDRADLIARIAKKEKDIEKINKRIAKWAKGLRPEDIEICKPFGNVVYGSPERGAAWGSYHGTPEYQQVSNAFRAYRSEHRDDIPTADDWNKGPNIDELRNAYVDLGEANNTLNKYKQQLQGMDDFQNEEKIPAIWNFLNDWEQKSYQWYKVNAQNYFELSQSFKEDWYEAKQQFLNKNPEPDRHLDYTAWRKWDRMLSNEKDRFTERYFYSINSFTKLITHIRKESRGEYPNTYYVPVSYSIDEDKLKKTLAEEKDRKYKDLVARVTSVVGTITDASHLTIGNQNGEINGYVEGHEGKCSVETISAGGYNIQCFHYRVLIHKIS